MEGDYTLDVLHPDRYPLSALASTSGAPRSTSISSTPAISTPATPLREGWVRIDDDVVVDVRPDDLFGAGRDRERDETRCAYLLFYRWV